MKNSAIDGSVLIRVIQENESSQWRVGAALHQGKREEQQDSIGFAPDIRYRNTSEKLMLVLCDGMGGLNNGSQFSTAAVNEAVRLFEEDPSFPDHLADKLNKLLCSCSPESNAPAGGTTLALLLITCNEIFWCAAGDSGIYLKRGERLYRLNESGNYESRLLDKVINGDLTREDAMNDPKKERLVSYIGGRKVEAVDQSVRAFHPEPGDIYLLCSDGIDRVLSEAEIFKALTVRAQKSSEALIKLAKNKNLPDQDNMSVITAALLYKE